MRGIPKNGILKNSLSITDPCHVLCLEKTIQDGKESRDDTANDPPYWASKCEGRGSARSYVNGSKASPEPTTVNQIQENEYRANDCANGGCHLTSH